MLDRHTNSYYNHKWNKRLGIIILQLILNVYQKMTVLSVLHSKKKYLPDDLGSSIRCLIWEVKLWIKEYTLSQVFTGFLIKCIDLITEMLPDGVSYKWIRKYFLNGYVPLSKRTNIDLSTAGKIITFYTLRDLTYSNMICMLKRGCESFRISCWNNIKL